MKKTLMTALALLIMTVMSSGVWGATLKCFASAQYRGQYMAVPNISDYVNQAQVASGGDVVDMPIPQIANTSYPNGKQPLILCPNVDTIPFSACFSSPSGDRCPGSAPTGTVTDGTAYSKMVSCRRVDDISGTFPDSMLVTSGSAGTVSIDIWKDCSQ